MENSSYHKNRIKGFDFNREDFKSPAKRNLMIGAEEADYVILADENVTSEEEIRQISRKMISCWIMVWLYLEKMCLTEK